MCRGFKRLSTVEKYCKHAACSTAWISYKPHVRHFHNKFSRWLLWSCMIQIFSPPYTSRIAIHSVNFGDMCRKHKSSLYNCCWYHLIWELKFNVQLHTSTSIFSVRVTFKLYVHFYFYRKKNILVLKYF